MKKAIDLIFSYFFIFASLFTGGIALKLFYHGQYLHAIVLVIAVLYLFGISCMGFNRLYFYIKGEEFNSEPHQTSV